MHCRGESACPSYFCDDVRPTHNNPQKQITKHSINFAHPIRACRARPYIGPHPVQWTLRRAINSHLAMKIIVKTHLPRPSNLCDDVRPTHDNPSAKKHITKHSTIFAHPIRAGRPAPTLGLLRYGYCVLGL